MGVILERMNNKKKATPAPQPGKSAMDVRTVLARNLRRLMQETPGKSTPEALERFCGGTSKRTIYNILSETYYPTIGHLENIAKAFQVDVAVLLQITDVYEIKEIFRVYNSTSEQGKGMIRLALEAAKKEIR